MKVRCIDAKDYKGRLTAGRSYDVEQNPDSAIMWSFTDDAGVLTNAYKERFEPVTDEPKLVAVPVKGNPGWVALEPVPDEPDLALLNLAFPCPPVDKYAEHRRKLEADGITENSVALETCAKQPMGTASLHAGLESEKVRERVKAFPKDARNPR